jgi:hypothetical protein
VRVFFLRYASDLFQAEDLVTYFCVFLLASDVRVSNGRPVTNSSLIFDYEYGAEEGLRPKEYKELAITQLFYTCNMVRLCSPIPVSSFISRFSADQLC